MKLIDLTVGVLKTLMHLKKKKKSSLELYNYECLKSLLLLTKILQRLIRSLYCTISKMLWLM